MGGGSYDRRTAINSAKKVKMRRVGSRVGMDIILVGRESVKKGVVQFIKAQKKVGKERESKGGQRAGVYDGGLYTEPQVGGESGWSLPTLQKDSKRSPHGVHVEVDFVTWDFFKVRNKMQHEE